MNEPTVRPLSGAADPSKNVDPGSSAAPVIAGREADACYGCGSPGAVKDAIYGYWCGRCSALKVLR